MQKTGFKNSCHNGLINYATNYNYRVEVKVYPKGDQSKAKVVNLTNTVHVLTIRPDATSFVPPNSYIYGYVYDKSTGKPLVNEEVEIFACLLG